MKCIEDILEKIDQYFLSKKKNEKWFIIIGITGFIFYLSYVYLLPYTKSFYNISIDRKENIAKNIQENTSYLDSIIKNGDKEFYVKKFDINILDKRENIKNLDEKIIILNENLEKLSDMLFNKKSWSTFLNSITNRAKTQNIDIQYLTNNYIDNNGSFAHVLEIGIGCKGTYKGLVKFINELEQTNLVTDVYSINFVSDNNSSLLMADINISVWGINH